MTLFAMATQSAKLYKSTMFIAMWTTHTCTCHFKSFNQKYQQTKNIQFKIICLRLYEDKTKIIVLILKETKLFMT